MEAVEDKSLGKGMGLINLDTGRELHRWAVETLRQAGPPRPTREAAMLDERASAALVRWGRLPNDHIGEEP